MKNQIGYMSFFALIVVACWAMRTRFDQDVVAEERVATSVDDLAIPMIESGKVAGLSIGIVSLDPSEKWQTETHHFGRSGSKTSAEVQLPTDETLYEIGGISKAFTGILLAIAVQKGEVALDTPAEDLMPPNVVMPSFGDRKVSLLDLATHRSGLPRLANNMPVAKTDDPYCDYTSQLAGEFLNQYELTRAPGSQYEYSNFAMSYLGYLLTSRSGVESYDALLSDQLTGPLGMTSTIVQLAEGDTKLAVGHTAAGAAAAPWNFADMPGAGGIRSTIADMNQFMIANLESPDNEIGKSIDLAFEKQVEPIADGFAMGLGWSIAGDGSTRYRNGQTGGFHAAMFLNRELKLGICVLSNTACRDIDELAGQLIQLNAGLKATVSSSRISGRFGKVYPRLSPFSAVRWRDQTPEVQINGKWYELISLNDHGADDILSFSRQNFGNNWKKRFEEDLVELLSRMGHPPQRDVKLVVKSLGSETTGTLERVTMTEDNRRSIYKAAQSR